MPLPRVLRPALLRSAAILFGAVALGVGGLAPARATDAELQSSADDSLQTTLKSSSLVITTANMDSPTAQDILAAARADYSNLVSVLYEQGYYGPTVSILVDGREANALSPFTVPETINKVVVRIDPGPRFSFGTATIAPLAEGTQLPDGFRSGQPARADVIKESVGTAIDAWRQQSYAKAGVTDQRIVARHPQAELDAEIALDPGRPLKFGRLIVEGNQDVRTRRILQIAGLPYGKPFDPDRLDTVARRLKKAGAFSAVSLTEAKTANPDGSLDITASVVEQKPRRFGFGAELSSTEGGKLTAYWMHRNILHGSERLRFDGSVSGIGTNSGSVRGGTGMDYSLSANFSRPGTFSPANTLNALAKIELLDEPDYYSKQGTLELGLTRELSKNTEVTGALRYFYSDVEDDLGKRQFQLLMLPLTGQYDGRDNPLNPAEGFYARLEVMPWVGLADSDSGGRIYGDGRYYTSFGEDNRLTLASRLLVGSVLGASIQGTPPDLLFYSGGGGTVRGQPYKSLNVDLGGGVHTGGRSFLGASGEARVHVTPKISVVGFYDYGMIGAESWVSDAKSHAGAGLGLRYDTAIGPIRLDVGAPVSGDTGKGVQLYIGIGQAF